jgi:uncharacterized protein (TIGR00369 family)
MTTDTKLPVTDPARTPLLPDWYGSVAKAGLPTTLGIEILELTESRVVATMPVDGRTRQPFGILHSGASIALAETVASFGATALVDRERFVAVGQEINGNHLRPKVDGVVRATGVPVHVGRSTQVWSIEIRDEEGRLVCISRCTMAIVERRYRVAPALRRRTVGATTSSARRGSPAADT